MANFRVAVISPIVQFLLLSILLLAVHPAPDSDAGSWDKDPCDAYSCTCMKEDASGECININCCQCKSEDADGVCAKVICGECLGDGCAECIAPRNVDTSEPSVNPSVSPSKSSSKVPSMTPSKTPSNAPTPQPDFHAPFKYVGNGSCIAGPDSKRFDYAYMKKTTDPNIVVTFEGCKDACRPLAKFGKVVGISVHTDNLSNLNCRCHTEKGLITSVEPGNGNCPQNADACNISGREDAIVPDRGTLNLGGTARHRCYAATPGFVRPPFEFEYIGDGSCVTHDNQHFSHMAFNPNKNPGLEIGIEGCKKICRPFNDLIRVVGIEFNSATGDKCYCRFAHPGYVTSGTSGQGNCPTNADHCYAHIYADAGYEVEKGTHSNIDHKCYKNVG